MPLALDTLVAIETPEHIVFRHRVAGPARRSLAYILDLAICYGVVAIVGVFCLLITLGTAGVSSASESIVKASIGLLLVILFCVQWVYFVVWEGLYGRTPGKMALGLRVVTTRARPIGFAAAALRNILRAADALPTGYVVGLVSMALTSRFQRLGDLVAGTMVVVPDQAGVASPLYLHPPAQPHELAALPEVVSLDADERAALELFLRRRTRLGAAREQELALIILTPLVARYGFRVPDPARTLALLYDRAANAGRSEAPPSSREPQHPQHQDRRQGTWR